MELPRTSEVYRNYFNLRKGSKILKFEKQEQQRLKGDHFSNIIHGPKVRSNEV